MYPFARLIPDSIEAHSSVSITVSLDAEEPPSDAFLDGIDN